MNSRTTKWARKSPKFPHRPFICQVCPDFPNYMENVDTLEGPLESGTIPREKKDMNVSYGHRTTTNTENFSPSTSSYFHSVIKLKQLLLCFGAMFSPVWTNENAHL